MADENSKIHKPTKEEADAKIEKIKPESASGKPSTDAAQFDPNTGKQTSETKK